MDLHEVRDVTRRLADGEATEDFQAVDRAGLGEKRRRQKQCQGGDK